MNNICEYFFDEPPQKIYKIADKILIDNETQRQNLLCDLKRLKLENSSQGFLLKHTENTRGITSIASSNMYRQIGITTPQIFLCKSKNKKLCSSIQQDISTISDEIITILAGDDLEFSKIENSLLSKFKWQIFYDKSLNDHFLTFLTENCLEELKNIFLIDELRTDIDRHTKNYFFYKSKDSNRYEGIIVIDLEQMIIFNYCKSSKDDFLNFLTFPYQSYTPHFTTDETSYCQRVHDVRDLIQEGALSESNIKTLINALKYNFPAEIKNLCKQKHLSLKERKLITSPIERLWEYNNQTIGKELGL